MTEDTNPSDNSELEPEPRVSRKLRFHLDKRAGKLAASIKPDDHLLTPEQVAEQLGVSRHWLQVVRLDGTGPPYVVLSERFIRYRRDALISWLRGREIVHRHGNVVPGRKPLARPVKKRPAE